MDHQKKLEFVLKMTKHALDSVQHLDSGGTVLSGPTGTGTAPATVNNNGLVGNIGNALGLNNQFQAQSANIQNGTNVGQLNTAYTGSQGALQGANSLASTLTPGVASGAASQANLAQMYMNQANGVGPNPAQTQLNQSTGANIASQAALAASQRGASANPGAIARQAALTGAGIQQNAVGQSATLQAQQQLAAEQNLQNLAGSQVAQGTGATQLDNQVQQNEQNILQGANTANNNANVSMQGNINNVNAGISTANQNQSSNIVGGLASGVSSVLGGLFAKGGMIRRPMAEGGVVGESTSGPQSYVGQWLNSTTDTAGPTTLPVTTLDTQIKSPFGKSSGGSKPSTPSIGTPAVVDAGTGATDLAPLAMAVAYKGGLAAKGGKVNAGKGERASVPDDSLKNDKIPTMLSEGEIVIPRHITMHPMAPEKAAAFVAQTLAKKRGLKS